MDGMSDYARRGFQVFAPEPALRTWAAHALEAAREALHDPTLDHWYQCERTWFVGLDSLPNDAAGRLPGGPPLASSVVDVAREALGHWPPLHRAQLSGVFPGYPRPREGESEAGFRYRLNRDAAHVDGVIGEGAPKRRFVREPHAFILGLPLTQADSQAAPLVVWEGSHHILRRAFAEAFAAAPDTPPEDLDVTEAYVAARTRIFDTCARVPVTAPPGGAILLHRLCLHGVAPFAPGATAAAEGRLIAYFRPPMPGGARAWVQETL
jgi:hypothetical protein